MEEEQQKKKRRLVEALSVAIVSILMVAWILNLGNVFESNSRDNGGQSLSADEKFEEAIDGVQKTVSQIKAVSAVIASSTASSTAVAASSSPSASIDPEAARQAAESLKPTASSSPAASSSLPLVGDRKATSSCPAYVDCMPKIGSEPSCAIPSGCEGITEKVY